MSSPRSAFIHLLAGLAIWVVVAIAPTQALARNCKSELPANLAEPTDWLAVGGEFRSLYLGAHVGDGFPLSGAEGLAPWDNRILLGVRPLIEIYPSDTLAVVVEADWRLRFPSWAERPVPHNDLRLTQALVEWEPGKFKITGGIQTLNYGTGALLDQRFLAVEAKLSFKPVSFTLFGGMTNRYLMKNALNCGFSEYISHTQAWKVTSTYMHENIALGANFAIKSLKPFKLKGMYLLSRPSSGELYSHSIAVTVGGPIVKRFLSFTVEPMLLINVDGFALPAALFQLRSNFAKGLDIRLGAAGSFRQASGVRFSAVYENMSWGTLQRFNLHQGMIGMARASYLIKDHVRPFAKYTVRFRQSNRGYDGLMGDELEFGVEGKISALYKLSGSYVAANLAGSNRPSHMAFVELRIVLGPQFEKKVEAEE